MHAPIDVVLLAVFVLEGVIAAAAGGALQHVLRHQEALGHHASRFAQYLMRAEAIRGADTTTGLPLVEPLTRRELEVARLLALGLSNDEMAATMFISLNTVKTHLKRIYDKLGVRTRTEAVAALLERGLLEDDEGSEPARPTRRCR